MAHDALSGPRYGPVHSLCADSLRVVRHGLSQDAELSRCHGAPLSCDGRPDRVPGSLQVLRGQRPQEPAGEEVASDHARAWMASRSAICWSIPTMGV